MTPRRPGDMTAEQAADRLRTLRAGGLEVEPNGYGGSYEPVPTRSNAPGARAVVRVFLETGRDRQLTDVTGLLTPNP